MTTVEELQNGCLFTIDNHLFIARKKLRMRNLRYGYFSCSQTDVHERLAWYVTLNGVCKRTWVPNGRKVQAVTDDPFSCIASWSYNRSSFLRRKPKPFDDHCVGDLLCLTTLQGSKLCVVRKDQKIRVIARHSDTKPDVFSTWGTTYDLEDYTPFLEITRICTPTINLICRNHNLCNYV